MPAPSPRKSTPAKKAAAQSAARHTASRPPPRCQGINPGNDPLDRVRTDASGQVLTTNPGVPIADHQNSRLLLASDTYDNALTHEAADLLVVKHPGQDSARQTPLLTRRFGCKRPWAASCIKMNRPNCRLPMIGTASGIVSGHGEDWITVKLVEFRPPFRASPGAVRISGWIPDLETGVFCVNSVEPTAAKKKALDKSRA